MFATFNAATFPDMKCKWCLRRIGLVTHAPVPVCTACFSEACADHTKWTRLCGEFSKEVRQHVRRSSRTTRPNALDVLSDANEGAASLQELAIGIQQASLANDRGAMERLHTEMQERLRVLTEYRQSAPAMLKELEKEDAE